MNQNHAINTEQVLSLRKAVHRQLIDSIDSTGPDLLNNATRIRSTIGQLLDEVQEQNGSLIPAYHRRQVEQQIVEDLGGFGPLASLMVDPEISDILVNGPFEVWVDRQGHLDKTEIQFDDHDHLRRILDRMVSAQGKHLDATSPMVDAKLSDGSRLHAVIPPLCATGAVISIRKFRVKPFTPDELVDNGFLSRPMMSFLKVMVAARVNIVIAGGASAGKTTMLNLVSQFIPENERIVTVEETAELRLHHPHVIPLEARVANSEGYGGINLRQMVSTALRMRADRIIVGEVRGDEVLDMLQAMNVGHDGSLTTVHANSPEDVIRRLETLALTGEGRIPRAAIREMIGSAVHLIVQLARLEDGTRRVVNISEVEQDGGELQVRRLFHYVCPPKKGNDLSGGHVFDGNNCKLLKRLERSGHTYNSLLNSVHQSEIGEF